jgi:hypothetical protein
MSSKRTEEPGLDKNVGVLGEDQLSSIRTNLTKNGREKRGRMMSRFIVVLFPFAFTWLLSRRSTERCRKMKVLEKRRYTTIVCSTFGARWIADLLVLIGHW